jgi:ATP-dependent Clp protease ATP-binding subunit ClpC
LIRLDMSEFQTADAVRKIIGDPLLGDASHGLTDRVSRQPFSVVLLDEFEKAHPNIWDLFLQVFDDGRLTDASGQTVDFRHCIIILTSNLGSTIRQDAGPGFVAQDHGLSDDKVHKAILQSFRPEFINRLDRIIVFRPLTRENMRRIVLKELSQVLERRGLRQREWAVEWEASALDFLLDKGFSPAMGARPLKRAIDEYLLSPLAATLVEHRFPEGDQFLFVRSDGHAVQVEFVDPDAAPEKAERQEAEPIAPSAALSAARIMLHPTGSAAEWSALSAELDRLEMEIEGERWTSIVSSLAARMQQPDFWNQPDRPAIFSRFEVMDRVKAAVAGARGLSRRVERSKNAAMRYSRDLMARLASQVFVLRHGIEDAFTDAPVEAVLTIQPVLERGDAPRAGAEWCERLTQMYRSWASLRGMRVDQDRESPAGRAIVVSGFGAWRLLAPEAGLHVLDYGDPDDSRRAVGRVTVTQTTGQLSRTPTNQQVVRRYQLEPSPVIRDLRQGWRTGNVDLVFNGHFDVMSELSPASQGRE